MIYISYGYCSRSSLWIRPGNRSQASVTRERAGRVRRARAAATPPPNSAALHDRRGDEGMGTKGECRGNRGVETVVVVDAVASRNAKGHPLGCRGPSQTSRRERSAGKHDLFLMFHLLPSLLTSLCFLCLWPRALHSVTGIHYRVDLPVCRRAHRLPRSTRGLDLSLLGCARDLAGAGDSTCPWELDFVPSR